MVLLGETGLRRRPVCMDNAHERTRILLMPYDLIHRKIICFNDERIGFIRDLLIDEVDWRLEAAFPACYAKRAPGSRQTTLLDTDRGRQEGCRGLSKDRSEQGARDTGGLS